MKKPFTPHITEKSYRLAGSKESLPQYTFKVAAGIGKDDLKALVEKEYKVSVIAVQSVHIPGKNRRFKGVMGRTSDLHKMIITLKKGDHIAAFEVDSQSTNAAKEETK
jgi:large subunit ribosomal protein L23